MRRFRRTVVLCALATLGLAGLPFTGAQTPRVPSRFVPGDTAVSAAANDQAAVFLAQGGDSVLAVWSDNRANSTGGYEGETSRDVYGIRIDGEGNLLDTTPFPVSAGPSSQEYPRAAWNGTCWLVVFESYDLTGTGYYYQKSLEAIRVGPDGRVLDPKPIKLFNMTPVGATWAVASDGSGWVVANQGTSTTGDIVAARISSSGVLLDPGPKSLVPETYYLRGGFHLAHAGGVFLLVYEESMTGSDPASAIRFDSDLNLLDPAPFNLAGSPLRRLASNGSGFYAVWNEQLPDFTMAVKGTRIDVTGQKLDGDGVNVSGPNPPQANTTTSVTWDGGTWKVTWGGPTGLRLARVGTTGGVLDPGGVAVAGPKTGITASAGNGTVQVAWTEYLSNNNDVHTAFIEASNAAGPNTALSVGAPSQTRLDIASGGGGYMLVYRSATASRNRILAQPLDGDGNPRTVEPTELESADATSSLGAPAIAWNGSVFLAAWSNANGVVARRLQADGAPVDPEPFVVLDPGFGPVDVEALGSDFLVAGLRCGINCQYISPIAARVRGSDGAVLDASPIQMGGTYSTTPRIVALGGRWLVVWRANATHDDCLANTLGSFISAGGIKEPDFAIHGYYSSCGGNGIFGIGLAASGGVALMVQSQELTSGVETDLLFRRIEADGTVHPYVNLTPWRGDQYRPQVSWDGTRFVVVWQDQKTGFDDWSLEQLDARSDLVGARVGEDGSILDPQGFVFSNSPAGEAYPNVASLGATTLIAGSLVRNLAPLVNYRIGYDLYGAGGNQWPVAVAAASPEGGDVFLTVDFSSAGSGDPDGAVSSYLWEFGDGATSTEANPSHLYTAGGPYVATLSVTDDRGAQTTQEVLVKALEPNVPPVAVASSNRTHGPSPLDVIFYATGSYDPDGFIGNIHWTFSDGGEYWGSPAYHTFTESGPHQATLTVYDGRGGTGTDALEITVDPPLPPAAPSAMSAIPFTSEWISTSWSDNSNNEDGFAVERCQGTEAFCGANPGDWLEIARTGRNIDYYDDRGLPSGTTFSYRTRAFNVTDFSPYSNIATAATKTAPPVAEMVPSVLSGGAPLFVGFDGSGSFDADGTIVSWDWEFGDGGTASGAVVSHTYGMPGTYYARLTVTDDDAATGSEQRTIVVKSGNTRSLASADAATPSGSILSGSYSDTRSQDDVAEVLIETRTSGSPSTRRSVLEHQWTMTVGAGNLQTFYLDAWHSANSEGDDFVFEYSRDGASWTPMIVVTKTADDDGLQSYRFAEDVTGSIFVRVLDLDRTPGRANTDTVSVDEMFVAASPSTGYSGEVAPNLPAEALEGMLLLSRDAFGQLHLSWGASCSVTDVDYAVYEGPIGDFGSHVPAQCSTAGVTSATITPADGSSYYLVVPNDQFFEGRYGVRSGGGEIPSGPTRCLPAAESTGCL